MFKLVVLCLVSVLFLLPAASEDSDKLEIYASVGLKYIDWFAMHGTDAIDHDSNIHKVADFTLKAGDNKYVGIALDLDDDIDEFRKFGVRLGFEEWGLYVEQGVVSGDVSNDSELDLSPSISRFEEDYTYLAFYKTPKNRWRKANRNGIGYISYETALDAHVNYGFAEEVQYVDPKAKITTIGWYFSYDQLTDAVYGSGGGWQFEAVGVIGLTLIEPSDTEASRIAGITGRVPDSETNAGIGAVSTFKYGYYQGDYDNEKGRGFGFSAGYEISMHGLIWSFSDEVSDNHKMFPEYFLFSHGPFANIAIAW